MTKLNFIALCGQYYKNEQDKAHHIERCPDNIKHVCAWCQKHLSGDPKAPRTSHGICVSCSRLYFPEEGHVTYRP